MRIAWLVVIASLVAGCDLLAPESREALDVVVPSGFPPLPVPLSNPLTPESVTLGRRLFFDPVLSGDGTVSCASCHLPEFAFADPRVVSEGVEGRLGIRNSPSLVNIAYVRHLFWDGGALTLENQVLAPLEDHREMDADLGELLDRLKADPTYVRQFESAFDAEPSVSTVTRAIAAYERTIVSGGGRYDRYRLGKADALTAVEREGLGLFEGRAGCATCHAGVLFTTGDFAHNGLAFAAADSGRARITLASEDFGRFKIPSLRNVGLTAPYMHDGRLATLQEVVAHYDAGGSGERGQDPAIQPLHLTPDERAALVAFLHTLTDEVIHEGIP